MRFRTRLLSILALASIAAVCPAGTAMSSAAPGDAPWAGAAPGAVAALVARGAWAWPVAPPHPIARPFVAPVTPYGPGHRGIDIRSGDTDVFAPESGIVSFVGSVAGRPVLSIRHPAGLVSSVEPVESTLSAGEAVSRGQLVGALLPGHCALVPCLHFGVRLNGEYVSPLNYLGGIRRAVLLPTRSR
jgi:murein DD-endopeptidase MepM/ murein hydrolase activator NlpD